MPLTQLACLGLSHHTAPVALRERISCALPIPSAIHAVNLDVSGSISELAVVSTCNRIEIYACVPDAQVDAQEALLDYLVAQHEEDISAYKEHFYFLEGMDAADHLLRVAAGLDSQILGEPQILGQVTNSFTRAIGAGTIGPILTALFRSAIRTGKRARSETAISSNPASISSVAIALAEGACRDLRQCSALVVGLGEMGQLALNALQKRGVTQLAVVNRSRERAERIGQRYHALVYGFEEIVEAIAASDVVISATAAPRTIIRARDVQAAVGGRHARPLVMIDVALPRDIEPLAGNLPGVRLFNMDHLRETLDKALTARRKEIPQVETIIAEEVEMLELHYREFAVQPLIVNLRKKAEAIRQQELERTFRFIGDELDPETREHIQHLSRSLVNKLLHNPTVRLRQVAGNGQASRYASTVSDLFDLDPSHNA